MTDISTEKNWLLNTVDRPVFIVGTMRSGTSFLGLALNAVSSLIGCPFELRRVWSRAGRVPMASDVGDTVCPCLGEQDLWQGQAEALRRAFQKEVLDNLGTKTLSPNSRLLNKCPHLCNKLELVKALFPDATFIWTLRSLDQVVISLKNLFLRPYLVEQDCYHVWPHPSSEPSARCFSVHGNHHPAMAEVDRVFPGGNIRFLAEYWLESNIAVANSLASLDDQQRLAVPHRDVLERPHFIASRLEQILRLDKGECHAVNRDANSAATRQWSHTLSSDEEVQLNDFKDQHHKQIQLVLDAAEQFK